MNRMLENHKKAKKNGGFSLVELIIVVAILAVLTALLAPQYFQYIERSRKAVDVNTAAEVLQAVKVACIDPDNTGACAMRIQWDGSKAGSVAGCVTGLAETGTGTAPTFATDVAADVTEVIRDAAANKSSFASTAGPMIVTVGYAANTGFTFTVNAAWAAAVNATPTA